MENFQIRNTGLQYLQVEPESPLRSGSGSSPTKIAGSRNTGYEMSC